MDVYGFLKYLRINVARQLFHGSLLSIHSFSGDIAEPHLWVWNNRERKLVCFASPEGNLADKMTEWPPHESTAIRDCVRVGNVTVDTSALIDGVPSRLIYCGLLKNSLIGIPAAATAELQRLEELGKRDRTDKSPVEKSKRGFDEIRRLVHFKDERTIKLDLDQSDSPVDSSLPLDSVARSTIMDKEIRKVATNRKSLLVTCDSGLATLAINYPNVTVLHIRPNSLGPNLKCIRTWRLWLLLMNWAKEQAIVFDYRFESGKIVKVRCSYESEDKIILQRFS